MQLFPITVSPLPTQRLPFELKGPVMTEDARTDSGDARQVEPPTLRLAWIANASETLTREPAYMAFLVLRVPAILSEDATDIWDTIVEFIPTERNWAMTPDREEIAEAKFSGPAIEALAAMKRLEFTEMELPSLSVDFTDTESPKVELK